MKYLYVLNSGEGTVSVLDADNGRELLRRDLDRMVSARRGVYLAPRKILADRQRERLYILCPSDDLLICCDRQFSRLHYARSVPSGPSCMVLSPDEVFCCVACADSDAVMQLTAAGGRQRMMVRTRPYPTCLYVGDMLVCACVNGKSLTAYRLSDLASRETLLLEGLPMDLCTDGRGHLLVAEITCRQEWDGNISVVDVKEMRIIRTVSINMAPGRICAAGEGFAVTENGGTKLKFFNLQLECVARCETVGPADEMVYDADTDSLYVSNGTDHSVSVFDCGNLVERDRFPVGLEPAGLLLVNG